MANMGLLSTGVFLVVLAVSIVIYSANIITLQEMLPLIIGLYGFWIMILGGIRRRNPSKYERGALSTFTWGLLLTIVGFSSILSLRGLINWLFALAAALLVIGILAIAVAMERK